MTPPIAETVTATIEQASTGISKLNLKSSDAAKETVRNDPSIMLNIAEFNFFV